MSTIEEREQKFWVDVVTVTPRGPWRVRHDNANRISQEGEYLAVYHDDVVVALYAPGGWNNAKVAQVDAEFHARLHDDLRKLDERNHGSLIWRMFSRW